MTPEEAEAAARQAYDDWCMTDDWGDRIRRMKAAHASGLPYRVVGKIWRLSAERVRELCREKK